MGDPSIEERLAVLIEEHAPLEDSGGVCCCGWWERDGEWAAHAAAAVVSGLREVGYTITWSTRWEGSE